MTDFFSYFWDIFVCFVNTCGVFFFFLHSRRQWISHYLMYVNCILFILYDVLFFSFLWNSVNFLGEYLILDDFIFKMNYIWDNKNN